MCASHSFTRYTTHPSLSLQSDATRHPPAGHRRPPIPIAPRPPPTSDLQLQEPTFLPLRKLFRFSPRENAVPVRHIQPRDPLDVGHDSRISVL
jgi:hypothetical protein